MSTRVRAIVMLLLTGSFVGAGAADLNGDAAALPSVDLLEFLADWQDEDGELLDPEMFLPAPQPVRDPPPGASNTAPQASPASGAAR